MLALLHFGCGESKPPGGGFATGGGASNAAAGGGGVVLGASGAYPGTGGNAAATGGSPNELPVLPADGVTYHQHTAPILIGKCAGCHQAGSIAPFSLTTYDESKQWGPLLMPAIDSGSMPPWGAQNTEGCQPRFGFQHDRRLSAQEKALLRAWVETGMSEGDPAMAAPLPPLDSQTLTDSNLTVKMPVSASVGGKDDQFLCFSLDPEVTSDVWLTATHINAGNTKIVHHVLVYADAQGESAAKATAGGGSYPCLGGPGLGNDVALVGVWAPGGGPVRMPPDVGIPLNAGSRLVMQVHYHPTGAGAETDDSTSVSLKFVTSKPGSIGRLALIGNFGPEHEAQAGGPGFGLLPGPNDPPNGPAFVIPAGAQGHAEVMRFQVPGGEALARAGFQYQVFGVGTHMHYVGRDMSIKVHRPAPRPGQPMDECLVQTPDWDFNWQGAYFYDAPLSEVPTLAPGDELTMRCVYDNSLSNPFLPAALDSQGLAAPVDVRLGESSLEEMCLGVFGVAVPNQFENLLP